MFLFQQYSGSSNVPFREFYLSRTSDESLEQSTSKQSTSGTQSQSTSEQTTQAQRDADDKSEQKSRSESDQKSRSESNKKKAIEEKPVATIEGVPLDKLNILSNPSQQTPLIQGSIPKEAAILAHANIQGLGDELSQEKLDKIRTLYERLDLDNDGTINIRDLSRALQNEANHIPSNYAGRILKRISKNDKHEIDFPEFIQYVIDHERNLEVIFKDLDRNKDGYIDIREIKNYCNDLGVPISDAKATYIVEKMDQTGSASIDLSEFQKFMLFFPSDNAGDIVNFWRHNLIIDIGEDSQLPEEFTQIEMATGVWWRHLVAGGIAGSISRTATAPLDRLKVFLQVHSSKASPFSVKDGIKFLYKEGGVASFWRGNGINVLKIAPESAFKFMAYEQMKRLIQRVKHSNELSIYERFMAGSTAGAISQSLIYPMEVLKTRLALRYTGDMDKGLIRFATDLYKKEGISCFYRGYVPNLIGIIPYAGVDLSIYETLKSIYTKSHSNAEPGVLALLLCGTCSSTCGQCVSYPLALIRTRLQARSISKDKNQPDNLIGQFKYIIRNEGLTGLYRGITPNFMKVIPAVSISYVVYEQVRKQLGATMT